jgi:hypothetical protein
MWKLKPENNCRNHPQGAVALGQLLVPGRQASVLLEPVEEPLHPVAVPIHLSVERPAPPLIAQPWNGVPDAPASAEGPVTSARIPLVTRHPVGPYSRPATPTPLHLPLAQQLFKDRGLVPLAGGNHDGQRLAAALGSEVHLGAQAAPAASQGLGCRVPPFAPAACWWARTTEPSTKCNCQSRRPSASACCWRVARIRSQTPARRQRRKRLCTVDQEPYCSGISRQGAPVRSFHRMPLMIWRWALAGRPVAGFCGGSKGSSRAHCSLVSSPRYGISLW